MDHTEYKEKGFFDVINEIFTSPSYLKYAEVKKKMINEKEWPDAFYIDEILKILNLPRNETVIQFLNEHLDTIKENYSESGYDSFSLFIRENVNMQLINSTYLSMPIINILESAFEKIII